MRRRQFLRNAGGAGLLLGAGWPLLAPSPKALEIRPNLSRVEARFYKKLPDREIECELCPRACRLGDRERGYCGVRENIDGTYYTLVYGKACSLNVDPIEKKPFFHFLPGTNALSLATAGCNVNCRFCQNWTISQVRPEQVDHFDLPPPAVAAEAGRYGCPSIAYTYTEPVVFFEYMYDTALEAKRKRIRSVVVTGGYIKPDPLRKMLEAVDAVKVDLKGFTQEFYAEYVRGDLQPVLETIRTVGRSRVWLEIVYLVIPTLNDRMEDIRKMARWVREEVGAQVPLHFSRFHPQYLIKNLPPTPVSTLTAAREAALEEGLRFVYVGNVPGHAGENTYCPDCRKPVIRRVGYAIESLHIKRDTCEFCGIRIPGVWA